MFTGSGRDVGAEEEEEEAEEGEQRDEVDGPRRPAAGRLVGLALRRLLGHPHRRRLRSVASASDEGGGVLLLLLRRRREAEPVHFDRRGARWWEAFEFGRGKVDGGVGATDL